MSAKTVVQETVTNGPGMISGAHPGVKTENTPLDQWRTLDVQSNSHEKDRNYTGATAAERPLVVVHHLRAVLATAKGLCVCCVWCVVWVGGWVGVWVGVCVCGCVCVCDVWRR